MSVLDALIINPVTTKNLYQSLGDSFAAIEPPIWAAMLASSLRQKDFAVDILDAEALAMTPVQVADFVSRNKPNYIVVTVYGHNPSASTQSMYPAGVMCKTIKQYCPDCKIIMVGGHVSVLPERTLEEEAIDFVCQGEGLETLEALLQVKKDDVALYSKVPGLWYRDEGQPVFAREASIIPQERMDIEYPGMAFDLLPMEKYRAHNWHCFGKDINNRQPYAALYTSLGCPFKCSFCCINAPFGKPCFRYWTPEHSIKQFDILAEKYAVKNIKIADEMFVLNENHFMALCKLLKERNYGFNIWAYARVDTIKPQYLEALKAAGVNWLALGIESASSDVRNGVQKGKFDGSDIRRIVSDIKEAGINVMGNFIFGLPNDNIERMKSTLDLMLDLNCEMVNVYSAMAYPGSELYDIAVKDNMILPESWDGYSQLGYNTRPLDTNYLSGGQVLAFRDYAWETYFTSSSYQNLIKDKFGTETLDHVKDLTKHQLKRKYADKSFVTDAIRDD